MVLAVWAGDNGAVKVSPWWLVASYGVITWENYVFHQWDYPSFPNFLLQELQL
jgi:hypothetical protein